MPAELVKVTRSPVPAVTATPEAVKAAFRKEGDVFADLGVRYLDPIVDLADRRMCERQMYLALADVLRGAGAVLLTALLAAAWPASRAARLEPSRALRS